MTRDIYTHVAGAGLTNHPVDRAKALVILRAARAAGEYEKGLRAVMDARAAHRTWITRTQREWQAAHTRRPSRARHHDSIEIREKYVRCAL